MALLSGLAWESIVRTLDMRERVKGIADGTIDGHRYTIIQRGEKIYVVLPDYKPREECLEAAKKIFSKLNPEATIQIVKMGHASSQCNYCLKPTSMPYRCYRCNGWYCKSHRLPEQHNCPGGKGRAETVAAKTRKIEKKVEEIKKRKIIVVEAPCG